ncbi:MAG TPA: S8 family serine peptidase [Actinoallomurus sp.]
MSAARAVAVALAGAVLTGAPLLPSAPASAAGKCAAPARKVVGAVPWAQRVLAPERAWALTRGGGLIVGIVDTGVSAATPALSGAVLSGRDVLAHGAADTDCRGHGTFVAGLLAARPKAGSGLAGIAPGVRLLPIRVAPDENQVDPGPLAAGIRAAVAGGARVIAVGVATATSTSALRGAVAYANAHDVVVVASTDMAGMSATGDAVYPAGLPGVLAVASVEADGRPASSLGSKERPDLAAPGSDLLSVAPRGNGNVTASGSGVAVAFVAGAAALVRAYRPGLKAGEVRHRLEATADHPTGRLPDPAVGYGMADPVAAVTTALPEESGEPAPEPHVRQVHFVLPPRPDRDREHRALVTAATVGSAAALGWLVIATIRRGRRRGWRPGTGQD